jgi:membrane associated rhomboid family serine protease
MPLAKKVKASFYFLIAIWVVFLLNSILPLNLNQYGIQPRTLSGLFGIFLAPFLHGNLPHIISNSIPLFILTLVLLVFYEKQAFGTILGIILLGGFLVWLLADFFTNYTVHIGASGLIYGLVAFLILSGIFQRSSKSLLISILVFLVYGGIFYYILPHRPNISWEGHLFGALAGCYMAYAYRNRMLNNSIS